MEDIITKEEIEEIERSNCPIEKREQYLAMNEKYKQELLDIVNEHYGPWDNFLGAFFDVIVRHWKDYYKLGYNVQGMEIKDTPEFNRPDRPTRYEIACEMERLYNRWNDFTGMDDHLQYYDKYRKEDGSVDIDLINKDYLQYKKDFFDYYMEYAPDMWD